jgi:hypothetical protein
VSTVDFSHELPAFVADFHDILARDVVETFPLVALPKKNSRKYFKTLVLNPKRMKIRIPELIGI